MSDPNALMRDRPESHGALESLVIAAAVSSAVAVVAGVSSDSTSGLVRVAFGLVMIVAGLYAVYTIGVLIIWFGLNRMVEGITGSDRPRRFLADRLPWFVWVFVPLLTGAWALSAWLSGYDASEWLWSGASVVAASVVVVAAYFRRSGE